MTNAAVRRLFVNASYFLLNKEVPGESKVDLVGDYTPSAYTFHEDEYWDKRNLKIVDLQ